MRDDAACWNEEGERDGCDEDAINGTDAGADDAGQLPVSQLHGQRVHHCNVTGSY